ncbi:MAG: class I SAM-dependent methyltransferase [Bacillota bacterium]
MSNEKFSGVDDTLFIPLAARVEGCIRFPQYFYDKKSLELKELPQVTAVNEKSSEYTMLASVARYSVMDKIVAKFLQDNKGGVVVNLGVGLETMNYRLADKKCTFYGLDFSNVIASRQQLLGEADNEIFLPYDIMDFEWTNKVPKDKPVLLVASGVFQYFQPADVSKFIADIKLKFANAELLFDATNEEGIMYAQKYVQKTGNTSAMMYFYVNDGKEFCEQENITFIEQKPFFTEARKTLKKLKLYTRIAMRVVDNKKRAVVFYAKVI